MAFARISLSNHRENAKAGARFSISRRQHEECQGNYLREKEVQKKEKTDVTARRIHASVSIDRVEQSVYFVRDGEDRMQGPVVIIDGKSKVTTAVNLLAVPYVAIGDGGQVPPKHVLFGLVTLPDFKGWINCRKRTTVKQHNNFLDEKSVARLSCVLIDTNLHPEGFRVCVCPSRHEHLGLLRCLHGIEVISPSPPSSTEEEGQKRRSPMIYRDGIPVIHKMMFRGGNQHLPGESICVSQVFPLPLPPNQQTDLSSADLLNYTYGLGYKSRDIADCIGQNMYFGYCGYAIPKPTLLEGPGEAKQYPYGRTNFMIRR